MAKKATKAAAAAIQITEDCERDADGFGAHAALHLIPNGVERSELSAAKATLLAASFESREVTCPDVAWNPRNDADDEVDPSWTLVAVVKVISEDPAQIVALFARQAGMVDQVPEGKPWPFPKGESGGPDAASEPAITDAPAMTKTEAHLQRKAAQFELPEQIEVLLKSFTPRIEKHGDEDVSAASFGFTVTAPNTILDLLSPTLRQTLYAAADLGAKVDGKPASQRTIDGVEESTPLLRTKVIESLKLSNAYEGWTMLVYQGIDDPFTISGSKVDKFVVSPLDGGTVNLAFRVGSSDIDEHEAGWFYGHLGQDIVITLHAPQAKPEPIDGTVAAFERDHPPGEQPSAEDLFAAAHGGDDEDGDQDHSDDREEAAQES